MRSINCFFRNLFFLLIGILSLQPVSSQDKRSLRELLTYGEANYPQLQSRHFKLLAAEKQEAMTKKKFMPGLDASYGLNFATFNNITGMNYPQFLLPISGPPSSGNTFEGVFGSSASLLFNWQAISFGRRNAEIDVAKASTQKARAGFEDALFRYKVQLITSYLDLLSAHQLFSLSNENVERVKTSLTISQNLVNTGIKPGVDTALLMAELARAGMESQTAQYTIQNNLIQLQELIGSDSLSIEIDSVHFFQLPIAMNIADSSQHPRIRMAAAEIDEVSSRKKSLEKSSLPVLGFWGTTYARGSGIDYLGNVEATKGVAFQRFNYGLGVQLSLPILQQARIRPQVQQEALLLEAAKKEYAAVQWELQKQDQIALINWKNAVALAEQSNQLYESTRFSYQAMLTRYETGLANLSDLVQVQYQLTKASTDRKAAHLNAWRAQLYKAAVAGNIDLFLNQIK